MDASVLRSVSPLAALLTQFRSRYPTASLVAELLMIHDGNYVVRALVQMGDTTLVSGMAAAPDVETAEDRAKVRALESLALQPAAPALPKAPASPPGYELQVRLMTPDNPPLPEPIASTPALPDEGMSLPTDFKAIESYSDTPVAASDPALTELLASIDSEPTAKAKPKSATSKTAASKTVSTSAKAIPALDPPALDPMPEPELASPIEPELAPPPAEVENTSIDLSDVIAQTTVELKRLGWSNTKGREHLELTYGKRSRQQLTDSELLDFLRYLESQPSPNQTPF